MNQVMLAILDRNPHAFRDNNVNRLQRGAELSMPERAEIEALSPREADQRMQAQMQAWRDRVPERRDVPIVAEEAVPEVEAPREEEPAEAVPDPETVHRLEVVPPESDLFDEGPVVSEGEIQRASRRLGELEDRMYADGLETDELYRQIEDIREAIETRDAAGLAVADEEMAVLESRLRRARLARLDAPQRIPDPDADEDAIGEYFGELEEELAVTDPDAREEGVTEPRPDPVDETVPEPQPGEAPAVAEPEAAGLPWWLWLVAALIVLGLVAVAIIVLRRRADTGMRSSPAATRRGEDAIEAARKRVAADPKNLAAHLALVQALADNNENERFAEALDNMYRQVDSDEHPDWQEALNLAVTHAPDHPLLTPPEERFEDDVDDDEGLDDRTREMLGILESDEDARPTPDDYELGSDAEPDTDIGGEEVFTTEEDRQDEGSAQSDTRLMDEEQSESIDDGEDIGEDLDLAEVSDRLDDPALSTREEDGPTSSESDDELDISEFEIDDERDRAEDIFAEEDGDDGSESEPFAGADPDALSLDMDDDLDISEDVEPDQHPEVSEDDLPGADESGDREIEAFLAGDGDGEESEPESAGPQQGDGEPELSDEDAEVKLDLARAYLSMDDPESARALLEEITSGGSETMREQAAKLLEDL